MFPPLKLRCPSDGNELFYVKTTKGKTGVFFSYSYSISKTKLNCFLMITEQELKKYMDNKIFVEV